MLQHYQYLLPKQGTALEIASGRGANALLLAESGLHTTAIDISQTANELLSAAAVARGLSINIITAPVEEALNDNHGSYDVIVVSRFLDRQLLKQLPQWLKPGGLLFYQTFVKEKAVENAGPSNPDFLLNANELLDLANKLRVRVFIDLGCVGDTSTGMRNESCLIAQKIS